MEGLLAGLPASCANGLLSGPGKHLTFPGGGYSALHILALLGFMALGRIRRPEGLRHVAPGELGKVAGLDRVPEVRRQVRLQTVPSVSAYRWSYATSTGDLSAEPNKRGIPPTWIQPSQML